MRRFSAIFFVTLYITSTTEASQLLKLPVILQHYHEHHQANTEMSFIDFLDMHYMHGSPHDEDYDRDMQLPFKKADHHVSFSSISVPAFTQLKMSYISPVPRTIFIMRNDDHLYITYQPSIFQPPRG